MATQHLCFIRKFEKVAIVVTVMDVEDLKEIPNESFVVASTTKNIYTGNMPTINISSQKFDTGEEVKGMGIDGILCSPNWFIRKIKTGLEGLIGG